MIKLQKISKVYNRPQKTIILKDINLNIKKGEFISIVGPSGSGKTTLLNIIGLLDKPSEGSYLLNNETLKLNNLFKLKGLRGHKIGYIMQNFALIEDYTVKENLKIPTKNKATDIELKEVLIKVNLLSEDILNKKPSELSGGQQQRVAIARALLLNPDILIADEPTGNLDHENSNNIIELLKKLNNEGKTIILVTHDLEIASRTDKIYKLTDSKLISN